MVSLKISREVKTDVLIIGAGAAGIRTAIALHTNNISCLVISKREFNDAHTKMASGGINASLGSLDPEDSWEIHAADTLREGHFINDPAAVELVCKNAPDIIRELQEWGCPFNLTKDGKIDQRFFGAQAFRRTCFVSDKIGQAILNTLVEKALSLNIPYSSGIHIFKIIQVESRIAGALGIDTKNKEIVFFKSPIIVLAAGGYASVYGRSSSRPNENLGDNIYLAFHAGAILKDMEMVQFHPTGMVKPEDHVGKLVTEAVRGEGGYLLNKQKDRFMSRYSPEKKELDARDRVARAIAMEIFKGNGTKNKAVYLDISHKKPELIKENLTQMYERFKSLGVDITKEAMEVAPTCHYSMGGIQVDFNDASTNIPGLYAVGEATSGLHGANRLGGNSLIETQVLGKRAGEKITEYFQHFMENSEEGSYSTEPLLSEITGCPDPLKHIMEVKELMWDHVGIIRSEESLQKGMTKLQQIKQKIQSSSQPISGYSLDILAKNMDLNSVMLTAELILQAAFYRKESRGAHYREDFPEQSDEWAKNILLSRGQKGQIMIKVKQPGKLNDQIKKALKENHQLNYHHLE